MKKLVCLNFTALIFTLAFTFSSYSQAVVPPEVSKYISQRAKIEDADEYPDARKIVKTDMNGDRKSDLVVLYTLEGFGGGNAHRQYIAVFLSKGNRYALSVNEVVGGKLNRDVELKRVVGKSIYLTTLGYGKNDGGCCPSVKGKTRYVYSNGRLTEKRWVG